MNQLRPKFPFPGWHNQASLHIKLLERQPLDLSFFMSGEQLELIWPHAARMALAAKREAEEEPAAKKARAASAKGKAKASAKPKAAPEWHSRHLELFRSVSIEWLFNPSEMDPGFCARVSYLPARQQEAAFFFTKKLEQEEQEPIHDIIPSLQWESAGLSQSPCIVCTGVLWCRPRRRQLHGYELMALQGMPMSAYTHAWDHGLLSEMAGSAFNGTEKSNRSSTMKRENGIDNAVAAQQQTTRHYL